MHDSLCSPLILDIPGWLTIHDWDCSANDIQWFENTTPAYCAAQCKSKSDCVAFNYLLSYRRCYLKSACLLRKVTSGHLIYVEDGE